MAVGPVVLNGTVTRTQDFTTVKHNQDQKGMIDQNNIQNQFNREISDHMTKIRHSDDAEAHNKKFDAKEKGNGAYAGDGGKKRKKKEEDGKVIIKKTTSFDIKI